MGPKVLAMGWLVVVAVSIPTGKIEKEQVPNITKCQKDIRHFTRVTCACATTKLQ